MHPTYEDPFDNNASKAQLGTDKLFSFIYLIRSRMPSNQIFYLIFFFLKFNVAYMATNNIKGKEDNIFTLYDILKAITIFGNNICFMLSGKDSIEEKFSFSLFIMLIFNNTFYHLIFLYLFCHF